MHITPEFIGLTNALEKQSFAKAVKTLYPVAKNAVKAVGRHIARNSGDYAIGAAGTTAAVAGKQAIDKYGPAVADKVKKGVQFVDDVWNMDRNIRRMAERYEQNRNVERKFDNMFSGDINSMIDYTKQTGKLPYNRPPMLPYQPQPYMPPDRNFIIPPMKEPSQELKKTYEVSQILKQLL